jgi:ATPase subunit of ABC transporter with duplicated ATPase domains
VAHTTPVADGEPVVPATAWILQQIAARPDDALTAAVVGPGGTGNSTLIKVIAAAYERAGVQTVRVGRDSDISAVADGRPMLIDDAHQLDSATLAAL